MTSKRVVANRNNARQSTGPRTTIGKMKSSRNAVRHGLNTPANVDPSLQHLIHELSESIQRKLSAEKSRVAVFRVAELFAELHRIKSAIKLLYAELGTSDFWINQHTNSGQQKHIHANQAEIERAFDAIIKDVSVGLKADQSRRPSSVLADLSKIERYERRTYSKLRKAIRALDLS